jgi:uncharacterized glyoxalase superfamily protein PhnB
MQSTNTTTTQSIYAAVRYRNGRAGIAWLKSIGFEEHEVYAGEGDSIEHAELSIGGNLIMLGSIKATDSTMKTPAEGGASTISIYIGLPTAADVDAVYARAKSIGAELPRELQDTDYGSHEFTVQDPDGHNWSFGTYRPQAATS